MKRVRTFRRTVAMGFAAIVALNLVVAAIALAGLTNVVARKDRVIDRDARLVLDVQKLLTIRDARAAANRGYLISGRLTFLQEQYAYDGLFDLQLQEITQLADTAHGWQLASDVAILQEQFKQLDRNPVELRQQGAEAEVWGAAWDKINSERVATTTAMNTLYDYQQTLVDNRKAAASEAASRDIRIIVAVVIASVIASAVLARVLTTRLRKRVGGAVAKVANSSAELQATANQQATGAQLQATAVTEISTNMAELLATSEQINGSASRVAGAAGQTAAAGHDGTRTVAAAQGSMTKIREQISSVLVHMAELGDKSTRIGDVLDIVSELAEQTNILAINANIEAAGAGETGRRFAIVANEIRLLADRVTDSAKEIRELIDGVRESVGTTALATEVGADAVESGSAQVEAVAASFEQIVGLVAATSEEASEIALSIRQQTIAVEQINAAVHGVAQSAVETEAGAGHTLQTASQLQHLSMTLHALIESSSRHDDDPEAALAGVGST